MKLGWIGNANVSAIESGEVGTSSILSESRGIVGMVHQSKELRFGRPRSRVL